MAWLGRLWLLTCLTLIPTFHVMQCAAADDPPEIVERPKDVAVRSGGIAAFYCRARGEPTPQLSWRKNGRKVSPQSPRYLVIPQPSMSVLRIDSAKAGKDDAKYECVAENGVGDAVVASATLSIYPETDLPSGFPRITSWPAQLPVVEKGRTHLLECGASGIPEPSISWIRDMVPVNLSNPRYQQIASDSKSKGSLQITNSEEEDQGKYECVAENSLGIEISNVSTLHVRVRRVPPYFSMPLQSIYEVKPGSSLNITCVAGGSPMPYVKWRKGLEDLEPEHSLPIGRNILVLEDIQESANYTCVASSKLGQVENTTFVRVEELPYAPSNVRISEITANSVHISWHYDGPPSEAVEFVIQYKPKLAPASDHLEVVGLKTNYYTVQGLYPFTEYEFYVVAVSAIGRGLASTATFVTTGETEPGTAPKNVQVRPLSSTTMLIQWEEPDTPNGQVIGYKVFYTTNPGLAIASWDSQVVDHNLLTTISDLTPHTIYTIRVQAETSVGSGPLSVPVQVKTQHGVPSQPTGLRAIDVSATSVSLEWARPHHTGENVNSYELYWNDTFTKEKHHRSLPVSETYVLNGLQPNTLYYIWLAAKSKRGEGATTPPIPVRTDQYVPTAPPQNVRAEPEDSSSVRVMWSAPPVDKQNGHISHYKLYYVEASRPDKEAIEMMLKSPLQDGTEFKLEELKKWTQYRIWLLAGTVVGDGPPSESITVRTQEDVPGDPQKVTVISVNSTSIRVEWKPPVEKEQYGIIRGYQIHVQEVDAKDAVVGQPLRYDVGAVEEYTIGGLQPDTSYAVQVAALTRKGDGARSAPKRVTTPGGVPNRPAVSLKIVKEEPTVSVEVVWSRPTQTYGELKGYRLRYGAKEVGSSSLGSSLGSSAVETNVNELLLDGPQIQHRLIEGLERGLEYEFRVAGRNHIGYGQEAVQLLPTPEGAPSGPPTNITYRFQTPDVVVVRWDVPALEQRNGRVTGYLIQFYKKVDNSVVTERNVSGATGKAVFTSLEENMDYEFRVQARTSKGSGPFSDRVLFRTERDIVRAPMAVRAMATSFSSVEVWWDTVPGRGKVIGYTVFYTMTAVDDLDEWQHKSVAVTGSCELANLERNSQYAVTVAARTKSGYGRLSDKVTVTVKPEDVPTELRAHSVSTHSMSLSWQQPIRLNPVNYKVTFDAVKEFVDSQGITQTQPIAPQTSIWSPDTLTFSVNELSPFTTYNVNVSAVPPDRSYRPPARITVTTQMAAPLPMVKPDFYGVRDGQQITIILPQASEEYGPISHYLLVVVPEDKRNDHKQPDQLMNSDLMQAGGVVGGGSGQAGQQGHANLKAGAAKPSEERSQPYVAAKFLRRNVPYTFLLGNGQEFEGMLNRKLDKTMRYRVFLRAVVDTPHKHLYTSSPFSDYLSLDMREAPAGELPQRPNPNVGNVDSSYVPVPSDAEEAGLLWIALAASGIVFVLLLATVVAVCSRRRRRSPKSSDHSSVTKPLMGGGGGVGLADASLSAGGPGAGEGVGVGAAAACVNDPVELRRLNFQTPGMASHPPIVIHDISAHIDALKLNDNLKFSQEYESIETGQQFTWEHSNADINKPKNRYANVVAYDHSRVVLEQVPGVPGSDYINGNFCDGYRKRDAYVATQGPLPESFADFWRMCWEQRTSTIVMMTRLEERARIKCDQYWPGRGSDTYGVVSVMITDVQELATYCVRTFQLHRLGTSEHREVKQLQFTAWPDHGVPDHPAPFLQFLKRVRALNSADSGPMVVHCSAGVGRTGAFIVIDSMLERLRYENTIDVYGHVTVLRAQRNYMVQTEDQYIFIHDALLEAVTCGDTEVPARSLHAHLHGLLQPCVQVADGGGGGGTRGTTSGGTLSNTMTGMQHEFKKLAAIRTLPGRFVSASLAANKPKNRLVNVLPYESTRVILQPMRGVEGSDYINASFVDGYRYRNAYIATQGPLAETTEDFWRMLWEHNSTIVVMLTKLQEMGQEKCHQYWPSDRSIRYQYVVVEPVTEYNMPQYILREFKMTDARDGQSRTVRQFQFTDWPEEGVPKSGEGFIEFLGQVHKTKEQFGQEGPITVHCSAGVGRTGVFITLSIDLERMQYEGVVDVFQTVRILRTQRPAMVQTEDQYQFCYRSALEYLGSFDHYAGCD